MALEGFRVTRPVAGRAASSSRARATFYEPAVEQIGPVVGAQVHVGLLYYPASMTVSRWDAALWGTGTWVDPKTHRVLDDISCDVISYSSNRGRDEPLGRFRTGTCSIVVNDPDGRYTPWNTEPVGVALIRPGIDVLVWVEIGSTVYPRFTGKVLAITDTFPDTGDQHQVVFECADYLSVLAAYDGYEQDPAGAGETSGARLTRICNDAGYDAGPRAFDTGTIPLQATTLAKNALDECGMVCDTELGVLFCDPDGTLTHRDRNGLTGDPHYTTVQAVFGDIDTPGEICYSEIQLNSDTARIENVVSIGNAGGSPVTIEDGGSRALYGTQTHRRFDLIHQADSESLVIANRHLDFYAFAANRIDELQPVVSLETLPDLLPLDVLWRIAVRRRAEGFQAVTDLQIQSITESVTGTEWTITFGTFDAAAIFAGGRWDTALWNTGLWGY